MDIKGVRKDLDQYFKQYLFTRSIKEPQYTPLLIVCEGHIVAVRKVEDALPFPDEAMVFHVWPGKTRGDIFHYKVGELKNRCHRPKSIEEVETTEMPRDLAKRVEKAKKKERKEKDELSTFDKDELDAIVDAL